MKIVKSGGLALLLCMSGLMAVSAVQAAQVVNSYMVVGSIWGPGTEQTYTLNSTPGQVGDTFVDNLVFNTPPFPDVWFRFGAQVMPGADGAPGIAFSSFKLTDWSGGDSYSFVNSFFGPESIGGLAYLSSGTYDLVITGTVLEIGGSYDFNGAADQLPEPASLSLVALGLLGVVGGARRRILAP